jgi:hypothetical protein
VVALLQVLDILEHTGAAHHHVPVAAATTRVVPTGTSAAAYAGAVSTGNSSSHASQARVGVSLRRTKETTIEARVVLDGEGRAVIDTGIGFLDHMLSALSKHSRIDIQLSCKVRAHSIFVAN